MNKIMKQVNSTTNEINYTLMVEGSDKAVDCKVIHEKKTGRDYIKLPKDNGTGVTFIVTTKLDNVDTYEFENKTTGPRTLSTGWRNKLTPEEALRVSKLELELEDIKETASKRPNPTIDKDSIEYLEQEMRKLEKRLEQKKMNQTKA